VLPVEHEDGLRDGIQRRRRLSRVARGPVGPAAGCRRPLWPDGTGGVRRRADHLPRRL